MMATPPVLPLLLALLLSGLGLVFASPRPPFSPGGQRTEAPEIMKANPPDLLLLLALILVGLGLLSTPPLPP